MKRILHRVDTADREAGLRLTAKKTKVLHVAGIDSQTNNEIKIDKVPLEKVNDFKHLGSILKQMMLHVLTTSNVE